MKIRKIGALFRHFSISCLKTCPVNFTGIRYIKSSLIQNKFQVNKVIRLSLTLKDSMSQKLFLLKIVLEIYH